MNVIPNFNSHCKPYTNDVAAWGIRRRRACKICIAGNFFEQMLLFGWDLIDQSPFLPSFLGGHS